MARKKLFANIMNVVAMSAMVMTSACAMVDVPDSRSVEIPAPRHADTRQKAINERPDSVMYLPLGEDVLVPGDGRHLPLKWSVRTNCAAKRWRCPSTILRLLPSHSKQEGLTSHYGGGLRSDLGRVMQGLLATNLYSYEDGTVIVKDTQTFTVTLPPIGPMTKTISMMGRSAAPSESELFVRGRAGDRRSDDPHHRLFRHAKGVCRPLPRACAPNGDDRV